MKGHTHLLACNAGTDARFVHDVLEDGGKWGNTDTPSYQHSHLILVPVLVTLSVWTVKEQLQ